MTHPNIYFVPFFLCAGGHVSSNSILFMGYQDHLMNHLVKFTIRDSIIMPTSIGAFEGSFNNDLFPNSDSVDIDFMRPVYNNTSGVLLIE
jgi:hypothetical protein